MPANLRPIFQQAKLRLAIQLLQRDFHVVTGRHGVIVLPQDAFYVQAGFIEGMDAQPAHDGHDQQETGEGNDQFGSDAHKNSTPIGWIRCNPHAWASQCIIACNSCLIYKSGQGELPGGISGRTIYPALRLQNEMPGVKPHIFSAGAKG